MEIQLIYLSKRKCSDEEIAKIMEKSVEKNKRLGITGFLIYSDEYFLQCLEGEKDTVNKLYETIKKDDRHSNIFLISIRLIQQRDFPGWSMGQKRVDISKIELDTKLSEQEMQQFRNILEGMEDNNAINIMKKLIEKI